MALRKVADDQWTRNPPSVTSTLSFSIEAFRVDSTDCYTLCCGMGWRFSVYQARKGSAVQPTTAVLQFDPYLLRDSNFRNLTITVTCSLAPKPSEHHVKSLQDLIQLGRFLLVDMHFEITIKFPANLGLDLPSVPSQRWVDSVIASVDGQDILDVVFFLYNNQSHSNKAWTSPRPIYASTALLKGQNDYLDTLLFSNDFAEASFVDISDIPSSMHEYDYESDSDFETDFEDPPDDSTSVKDLLERSTHVDTAPPVTPILGSSNAKDSKQNDEVGDSAKKTPRRLARSIPLKNFAFKTWKAFILYLETQRVTFKSSTSQSSTSSQTLTNLECSPKSMYRLADITGMEDLKDLAFSAICSSITENNVIEELFSSFTSRYSEVQSFEIRFLLNCPEVKITELCKKLSDGAFVERQHVVAGVLEALNESRINNAPRSKMSRSRSRSRSPRRRNRRPPSDEDDRSLHAPSDREIVPKTRFWEPFL